MTLNWLKSSRCDTTCLEVAYTRATRCDSGNCIEVGYTTSTHCGAGECIEVGFATSSRSASNGACVEVGHCHCGEGLVHVRDSKDPDGPVLRFDPDSWRAFLAAVKVDALSR